MSNTEFRMSKALSAYANCPSTRARDDLLARTDQEEICIYHLA